MSNLALKFLLEVAAFAALAYTGSVVGSGPWAVALAVALPAVAISVWARWNAPRSAHRLPNGSRIPLELTVLTTAGLAMFVAGAVMLALVYLVLVAINALLLTLLHQWEA